MLGYPNQFTLRRRLAALAVVFALVAGAASAQGYPSRQVRIVVSTAPGGNHDQITRAIAQKLAEHWKQVVIVEPKPGANSGLAALEVAKAKPDGYTILSTINGYAQNLAQSSPLYRQSAFMPVSMFAIYPLALVGGAATPATSLAEFVAYAKTHPGQLSYGSAGIGSTSHMIGAKLNKAESLDLVHVPYAGEAATYADLTSGRLSATFGSVGFYASRLSGTKLKVLAVAAPRRLKVYPDVPTFAEAGYPDLNLYTWGGFLVPAGTPSEVVDELAREVARIVAMPEIQQKIYDSGFEPAGNSPAEFARIIDADIDKFRKIVRDPDIRLQ